jgi:hypothetical protein
MDPASSFERAMRAKRHDDDDIAAGLHEDVDFFACL